MAKDKLTEYSATNASNDVIGDISVAEGMLPSAVNNALREQMTHLKNFSDGTDAIDALAVDNLKLDGNTISSTDTNGNVQIDPAGTGVVDVVGTLQSDGLTVDSGTIKLDGNYPTGTGNVALGDTALDDGSLSGGSNTAIGSAAMTANTSGASNTALGQNALASNSSGSSNVAIGSHAGYTTTTTGDGTFVGVGAGQNATSADHNTYIGRYAGGDMTSGTKNTIIGRYAGNQGGLDIRTSNNYIVLSDGDGNPRLYMAGNGALFSPQTQAQTTGAGANVFITGGQFYRSTSSQRYKNTITDATHGLAELMELRPVTYKHNENGDTIFGGLIAEEVHDAGLTEFVEYSQNDDGNDQPEAVYYSNMVSLCIKAIQEQQATITALTARITALEAE